MNNKENESCHKTSINWYPGHMAKTKKEIQEKLNLIDIIYEVIDARMPKSSRIEDIDILIKNKYHLLIMAKSDLCDITKTTKWVKYYEDKGIKTILVDLTNNKDYGKIITATKEIMNEINSKRLDKGLKAKEGKVLVLGIPNVGKSTLINQIANKKVTNVGNTPGITKNLNWLKTKYNLLLLDTPGILWPKIKDEEIALNLASLNSMKESIIPKDRVALHILDKLNKNYKDILFNRFKIEELSGDVEADYELIGRRLNIIATGNIVDIDRVSEYIINDLKNNIKGVTFD